jgi:hypothetical protein
MKRPGVWNNDEDIISEVRWRVNHGAMAEETGDLTCTAEYCIRFELGVLSFRHLFAQHLPGKDVDRKDDEDLEGMEASKGGLCWVSGGDEG